jgi:hypothetical protein
MYLTNPTSCLAGDRHTIDSFEKKTVEATNIHQPDAIAEENRTNMDYPSKKCERLPIYCGK